MKDNSLSQYPTAQPPPSLPPHLSQLNLNAAGIDIGATRHYVAVPAGRDAVCVRDFGTFTTELNRLADWLVQCGIDTVAMESTGVYWIPVYELLESRGLEVKLVNARHVKTVPGRKTDVLDCQWLQQLHTFGLLAGAFRPPEQLCVLRAYLRQGANWVRYAAVHIQHMQKALNQMNVQLHHVVSDITGVTGMKIIRAIVAGEQSPQRLADYRDYRCKQSREVIAQGLTGNYRPEHLFALKQALELYDTYHAKITECDQAIEQFLQTFDSRLEPTTLPLPPPRRPHQPERNQPRLELRTELYRITGVDLTRIDGISAYTALVVVSEIGLDMTRWPTYKHFTSWLGLCPGNKKSGGKVLSGKTKPSANRAAAALRLAAQGLHHSQSALGAYFRRQKTRLGAPKAATATAHKLARLIYSMLKHGTTYVDAGQDYYEQQYRQRVLQNLQRKARAMGYQLVTVESTDPAA